MTGNLQVLEKVYRQSLQQLNAPLSGRGEMQAARQVWRDTGVIKADMVRISFTRTMASCIALMHPV